MTALAPLPLAIGTPGPVELIIILVIVLLIFGPMKLPQIGDALGKSVKSFRSAMSGKDKAPVDVTPKQLPEGQTDAKTVDVASVEEQDAGA